MIETDLRKMGIAGFFINTVYRVETQLKSLKFNILLKKQDFIKKQAAYYLPSNVLKGLFDRN